MLNPLPHPVKPSLARRVTTFGAGLRRLVLAGVSARAGAVIPPRDRRCG